MADLEIWRAASAISEITSAPKPHNERNAGRKPIFDWARLHGEFAAHLSKRRGPRCKDDLIKHYQALHRELGLPGEPPGATAIRDAFRKAFGDPAWASISQPSEAAWTILRDAAAAYDSEHLKRLSGLRALTAC